jgi:outer membrane protein TolC
LTQPRFSAYGQNEISGGNSIITGVQSTIDLPKIFSGYPRYSRMLVSKAKINQSLASIDVKKNIAEQYYELYILSRRLSLYKNILLYYEGRVHELKAAQARGLQTGLDISREETNAEISKADISEIDAQKKLILMSIRSLSGLAVDSSSFTFGDMSDIDSAKTQVSSLPEESSKKQSGKNNQDYFLPDSIITGTLLAQSSFLDTAIAEEAMRWNRFAYAPSLQVGAELNTSQSAGYKIYGGLTFDISGFLSQGTETKKLSYDAAATRKLAEEDIRALSVTIRQLASEMQIAWENYRSMLRNVLRMRSANENALVLYRKGLVNETDMLDNYSLYIDSNEKMFESCYEYLVKRADLSALLESRSPE